MSDAPAASPEARSAGAMLRAARERQGLHIAALAAAIKVPQTKLEALEAGRYEDLTDATFVRALAHSVCRVLKIDAKPVLDLLPAVHSTLLERVDRGLKAPFHERPGQHEPTEARPWHQPVFWVVALLLLAAAAFVLWPSRTSWSLKWPLSLGGGEPAAAKPATTSAPRTNAPTATTPPVTTPVASEPAAPAALTTTPPPAATSSATAELPVATSPVITETVHSAPPDAIATSDAPAGLAVVRASEPSWVEAQDGRGNLLLSRTLQPGESVGLDGPVPLRLVIGNATATEVTLRGKRVTLGAPNRDNVVRLELR